MRLASRAVCQAVLPVVQTPASRQHRAKLRGLTVFSGFVSYEQLDQKLLGGQKKVLRWLPKNVEGPHPVRMRGPGTPHLAHLL